MLRYWIYRYKAERGGYVRAAGEYTPNEAQALRYAEPFDDVAILRYDYPANTPDFILSVKLPNGSFIDDLAEPRMGRPSQGRSSRLQVNVTPEVASWLESKRIADGDKSISDVVFSLLEGIRQSK